jgi:hypothetical protein
MSKISKRLGTITSSLLLACSLALAGATVANSAQSGHNEADSWWGATVVAEAGDTAAAPEFGTDPDAVTLGDSAWG